jgi:hypothetical protein
MSSMDARMDKPPYKGYFTPRTGLPLLPLAVGAGLLHKYYGLDKVSEAVSNTFGLNGITAKIPVSLDYTSVAYVGAGLMVARRAPILGILIAGAGIGWHHGLIQKVSNLVGLSGLLGSTESTSKGIPSEAGAIMLAGALAVGGCMLYKYNAAAAEKKSDKPQNQQKPENIPSKGLVEPPSNHPWARS